MRVLGLDPSLTNFGWAIHDSAKRGEARCEARGRMRTKSKDLFIDRYIVLREGLRNIIREHEPDAIGIESSTFGDMYSEGMYGLFLYSSEAIRLEDKSVVLFAPLQVKGWARELIDRPDGWKMQKADMCEVAKTDTTIGKWNHNEADAYLIGALAARFWQFQQGNLKADNLTKSEARMFARQHTFSRGKKKGQTERTGIIFKEDDRFFLWGD
jgi:hypothetical protein